MRLRDPQDHAAWMGFVSLYEPIAYRLFRRYGLQDADARELTQELFVTVSQNIERWNPDKQRGSFRGWLRRVARNLVINWLKHRQRRLVAVGGSAAFVMFQSVATDLPETREFDLEFRRAVFHRAAEQVQGEVQPLTWQAFWEAAMLRRPHSEVAERLAISTSKVRIAKCRVLARLRAAIKELEGDE
jgi:RNA polymerase sigma-70 factor (ECF subfamily)